MIDALQDFTTSLPSFLQWFGVMLISAIPFVESYFGSVVGVLIGLPTALAIGVAVIGNIISMLIFVMTAHGVRGKVVAGKAVRNKVSSAGAGGGSGVSGSATDGSAGVHQAASGVAVDAAPVETDETAESPRREKLRRMFDKYGVAGVSLIGQTFLPSQITSAAMVSFGANRNTVIFWQIISIVLWGTVFGVLATLGVSLSR
ncbi:hypothetical protein ASD23_13350 [Agromyces sp. Root1464]|uniref:hypothetical protein n=1 Tax=Agromyces sp. Root1464 TaxID=1736467 RepID=UPI0006F5281E|nr:hypothetical protein [Agromyces sp. Root1464]KQZ09256.1 hypothetical protein ASD23_13350 [Agromyces sp. Root1464]